MLIYSMSTSVDGFINDREGGFGWTVPTDELFAFQLARVRAQELIETRTFRSRVIYERYGRARHESD